MSLFDGVLSREGNAETNITREFDQCIIPAFSASSADIIFPVNTISMVLDLPIAVVILWLMKVLTTDQRHCLSLFLFLNLLSLRMIDIWSLQTHPRVGQSRTTLGMSVKWVVVFSVHVHSHRHTGLVWALNAVLSLTAMLLTLPSSMKQSVKVHAQILVLQLAVPIPVCTILLVLTCGVACIPLHKVPLIEVVGMICLLPAIPLSLLPLLCHLHYHHRHRPASCTLALPAVAEAAPLPPSCCTPVPPAPPTTTKHSSSGQWWAPALVPLACRIHHEMTPPFGRVPLPRRYEAPMAMPPNPGPAEAAAAKTSAGAAAPPAHCCSVARTRTRLMSARWVQCPTCHTPAFNNCYLVVHVT